MESDSVKEPMWYWLGRMLLVFVACTVGVNFISTFAWRKVLRDTNAEKRRRILQDLQLPIGRVRYMFVGFLHPHSHGGGGGERVLYEAILHHQRADPNIVCVVYTGDIAPLPGGVSKQEMLDKVRTQFGIELNENRVAFLPLAYVRLVGDNFWSMFTLAGQAIGANRMGYSAMLQLVPDVFIDTAGHAFTYSAVKNFSSRVRLGAYIHYPTISTDMLQRVRQRRPGHTNTPQIAQSLPRSMAKYVYYRLFAAVYGSALRHADVIVCNGHWTRAHVMDLLQYRIPRPWRTPTLPRLHVVYPPCQTASFTSLPLEGRDPHSLLSVAQFRPEKEHELQLRIVHGLLQKHPELKRPSSSGRALRLTLIGSCRHDADKKRLVALERLAKELMIENHIEWCVDAPFTTMIDKMRTASIGLSTMVDEHFGIAVVEYMAAGLLTLSHASAGPLMDIAVPVSGMQTGFHASCLDEYIDTAYRLMTMPPSTALKIRRIARERAASSFSDVEFHRRWRECMWKELVPPELLVENDRLLKQRAMALQAQAAGASPMPTVST